MQITCTINGRTHRFDCAPESRVLDLVREAGMTSVKAGCGEGECGACSLFVNGRLVNACLLLAPQIQDAEVVTLEGLQEETAAIRESFAEHGAVQCGFCTPGFVLRAYDYLSHGGERSEEAIKAALDGNLCRCTGYRKIVEAIVKVKS
ncbi:(2Fe-2S)-binding protein [Sulfurimonas sp. HSL-1656]|uniref:(2Fe-2S)-binding protein n=1 Tax=Thiomicrolovo subterrani TaxID=3131934 RepID=UPI0031F8614B